MTNYRHIYEEAFGPIPKDVDGRTYDVHHWDGDRTNNDIDNLWALSIQDHYDIHAWRGEWHACWLIARKMRKSHEELSELARLHAQKQLEKGTHPFMRKSDGSSLSSERQKDPTYVNPFQKRTDGTSVTSDRAVRGDHPWQTRPDGTSYASDLVVKGLCPLQKRPDGTSVSSDLIAKGIHHLQLNNPAKGTNWWTDGLTNRRSRECPGEGFHRGITMKVRQPEVEKDDGTVQDGEGRAPGGPGQARGQVGQVHREGQYSEEVEEETHPRP